MSGNDDTPISDRTRVPAEFARFVRGAVVELLLRVRGDTEHAERESDVDDDEGAEA